MKTEIPLKTRRMAKAALLCGAATGAALWYVAARRQQRSEARTAQVRGKLRRLDAALDQYATRVSQARRGPAGR